MISYSDVHFKNNAYIVHLAAVIDDNDFVCSVWFAVQSDIGGRNRGPWPFLNFKTLHRNSIFAIENHLSLAKWPP